MLTQSIAPLVTERRIDEAHLQGDLVSHLQISREEFVYRYGDYFDSYLATEPGRREFWSDSGAGLISYAQRGRYVLVGGGLIAPEAHKPQLLGEFVSYMQDAGLKSAFHNIGDDEVALFREHGFQVTKWGEEPIVDLGSCTWGGKAYEWVRRQTNYCQRHGVTAAEVAPNMLTISQWERTLEEMIQVSAECLAQKPQRREMRFFEGHIDDHEVGRRRVFVARSGYGAGRMEGFLVCTPMQGGRRWATELYRRRLDAVRGTVPFLFHQAMKQMQEEGVEQMGLCLDPGLRCSEKLPGDSALVRLGMTYGETWLSAVFDVAGLRHFKSRFRPRYESRYVCVQPHVTIGSLMAFARVSGLFDVDPWKVARILGNRVRKFASRSTLSDAA